MAIADPARLDDVCMCGDFRSQHQDCIGACEVCQYRNAPWDGCTEFRKAV